MSHFLGLPRELRVFSIRNPYRRVHAYAPLLADDYIDLLREKQQSLKEITVHTSPFSSSLLGPLRLSEFPHLKRISAVCTSLFGREEVGPSAPYTIQNIPLQTLLPKSLEYLTIASVWEPQHERLYPLLQQYIAVKPDAAPVLKEITIVLDVQWPEDPAVWPSQELKANAFRAGVRLVVEMDRNPTYGI